MAEHIEHMKDGIYEKVMSKEFADKLMEAIEAKKVWAERDDADAYEATGYLSSYLEKLIRLCLKDIADRNTEAVLSDEIELTNQLVEMLAERLPDLGHGHSVVKNQFLLKSLEHVANKTSPRKWESPDTSLTKSFLFTNSHNDTSMVSELRKEIMSADRIDFLVSFIRFSGLALLLPYLRDFTNKGGHLRVITTTYMGATDPKAVVELAKLPNTEIHISYNVKETRLHAKSYIFHRDSQFSTAYIGSSNLSHAAIAEGLEWNMKITEQDMPSIMEKMTATFETYWNSDEFQEFHVEQKDELIKAIDHERGRDGSGKNQVVYQFDIKPYPYQQAILDALEAERKQKNHWKNLVVAATGTGKTAISAFDYRNFMGSRLPQTTRLLFVAHREEILKQSQACFRQVLKNADFGELAVGGNRATSAEHLFISVQTFNSQKLWERMDADYYDMIIVDEFHHAAADSYQKLLSHFKPKILLGLTATPERMDGKSILTYFDNRMAAEIRLSDAIERRLLCPFHYFGVQDTTNLENVKWTSGDYDIKELTDLYTTSYGADKRAYAIMNAIEQYSADLRDVKGIGFCVSQKHAAFMADYMNKHDLPSIALDANSKKEDRDGAKRKLETGDIKFIFTVDIFNEGVDIPAVNTVLFLRPTNSMTVFIQQLGRGLRLDRGKDCLTVLDFVAQANKKYNFAGRFTALLGKKDVSIKKEIEGGFPHVPKGCAIQLEKVAQERILDNIKKQLSRYDFYKELVLELRETLGKVPTAAEFFEASKVEPHVFYNDKRTYARLCADAGIIPNFETTEEETFLQKAVPRMLSIDSTDWISFLLSLFDNDQEERYLTPLQKKYLRMWQWTIWGKDHEDAGMEAPLDAVHRLSKVTYIKEEIISLLTMQRESVEIVPQKVSVPYICPLDVYANYTRDQIFAALGFKKPNSIREGVKFLNMTNTDSITTDTDVFLVTLNKSEKEFSDTTLYEDYSISKTLFHWQSQSTTSDHSKTGQRYIQQNEKGNIVFLFVRKSKKDAYGKSMPYTFLGTAHFVNYEGSQPMSIIYRLDYPIPAKYIRTTDTAGVL